MPTVFLSGSIDAEAHKLLVSSVRLIEGSRSMGSDAFYMAMAEVDAILSKDDPAPLNNALFTRAPRLRYISRHGSACPGIDLQAAKQRGILLSNTGGVNAVTVAEGVLAIMLYMARHLDKLAYKQMLEPGADISCFRGMDLHGKTLGVVGVGNVGSEVVKRAQALGMRVLATHPAHSAYKAEIAGLSTENLVNLPTLFAQSHIVSLHAPMNVHTSGMIDDRVLSHARPDLLLINAARPGLVDEQALVAALNAGRLKGYALDAVPPVESCLRNRPDVMLSPHICTMTYGCAHRVGMTAVENILRFFAGETPLYLL